MQYDLILFLNSLRWQDIVDITLNSYILFRLYVLFRGTNVFRVLAGITLLWIFQRIAASIGLIVTSLAFQGIIALCPQHGVHLLFDVVWNTNLFWCVHLVAPFCARMRDYTGIMMAN